MRNFAPPILAALPLLFVACSHNVYTPPSRPMALESPNTVGKGKMAAHGTASTSSEIFGPSIIAASGGLRHGVSDELEMHVDLSYAQVIEDSAAGTNRAIGMGRVGAKYRPADSPHLALTAGLGGGYSPAAGAYASADAGAVVGYENPYVIPFISAGVFASFPVNPREVDTTEPGDEEIFRDTPENTQGLSFGVGVKVPIQTAAVLVGVSSTSLRDDDTSDGFLSLGAGVETSF